MIYYGYSCYTIIQRQLCAASPVGVTVRIGVNVLAARKAALAKSSA